LFSRERGDWIVFTSPGEVSKCFVLLSCLKFFLRHDAVRTGSFRKHRAVVITPAIRLLLFHPRDYACEDRQQGENAKRST
jgi:hypothetical protein